MRLLILSLLAPVLAFSQIVVPFENQVLVSDHGEPKRFTIAADEVAHRQSDGRFLVKTENVAKSVRSSPHSSQTRMVLYPEGAARTQANRRLLTEKILVQVKAGTDVAALASLMSISKWKPAAALENHYVFYTSSAETALATLDSLRAAPGVLSADYLLARMQSKRGGPNDPLFRLQWHLYNTGQNGGTVGIDSGVVNIWGTFGGAGIRGRGVMIGIVDDGVQFTHPDLQPNYDVTIDYDWNDISPSTAFPSQSNEDFHGTSVAGVAAARGGNGIGVSGVAPEARVTGLRLIADFVDDDTEGEAFLYRNDRISIKNNSWGPDDNGSTMEAPGPIALQALANATTQGRGGKGTIFVWAAGNGRENGDNSNYDGYGNSIYTIAVTAISNLGRGTTYGEAGANVIVGACSDNTVASGIVTTDLTGSGGYNLSDAEGELTDTNYTKTFGGTSSSTPVVSGIVALMLQKNPNLGWRDVQEILIRSAVKNNPTSGSWFTNAAGFHFNHNYGAGLAHATRAVNLAANWVNLKPQTRQTQSKSVLKIIPEFGGLSTTFSMPGRQRVEHVTVKLNISHARRGQLRVILTSPSGMSSLLAERHADTNSNINWTYMSVRNWGESASGTWTVKVEDVVSGTVGKLNSAQLTTYGSAF